MLVMRLTTVEVDLSSSLLIGLLSGETIRRRNLQIEA